MKIIPDKYKEEPNWQRWIKFKYPHGSRLSIVFLRRLAALARDMNQTMSYTLGYRPIEETQRLYDLDIKAHDGKSSGKVMIPGQSWHECYCAVDLSGAFWENISIQSWVPKSRFKQSLNEYGLMLPLNKIDSPSVVEWWHLQPVETHGIPGAGRNRFLDPDDEIYGDDEMDVKEFQRITGLVQDGLAGPKTKAKALEVLTIVQQILGLQDKTAQLKNDIKAVLNKY